MSETELVDSVLDRYVPLIFRVYEFMALRIKSKMWDEEMNPVKLLFSGKDNLLLNLVILIGRGDIPVQLLLLMPPGLFKVSAAKIDLKVASGGTGSAVILMYLFFDCYGRLSNQSNTPAVITTPFLSITALFLIKFTDSKFHS